MKILSDEARFRTVGVLGQGLVAALFATVRIRLDGVDGLRRLRREGTPVIFVFWHDQLLPLVHVHRNEGIVVLVSEHADGEYITRILLRKGFGAARGSSTRGGTRGLRELLRAARRGRDVGLTPDGPRGPRHHFKEGALMAARMTGHPLMPMGVGASSAWRFDSWDRFLVPRPFSRVRVAYGEPRHIPREASRSELRRYARELEETLNRLTARAGGEGAPQRGPGRAPERGGAGRREEEDRASAP